MDTDHFNQEPNGLNRVKQWDSLLNEGLSNLRSCDADIVKATSWKTK
ncbi:hypothetical protein [Burkholderia gladioli]|nr:hypothetical protein [Burkholderia gladioli]MBU9177074.1 hypothetical protein [Burkholderia gladioli]MDN7721258.1 hypothetical protein [Burkholderia gladioli]